MTPQQTIQAQAVAESYGNNNTSTEWIIIQTPNFKIVVPKGEEKIAAELAKQAEAVFEEYIIRIGRAPSHKITIYYNSEDSLVSGIRARNTDEEYSIWRGNTIMPRLLPGAYTRSVALRAEIAYAFQKDIQAFPVDYYFYLFSNPSQSPWSNGFIPYLAVPQIVAEDVNAAKDFSSEPIKNEAVKSPAIDWMNVLMGRSQMHYFNAAFSDSLSAIYTNRKMLLGFILYFDFNPAFAKATGISYSTFEEQWKRVMQTGLSQITSVKDPSQTAASSKADEFSRLGSSTKTYNSFVNTRWETPFFVPYYVNPGDFGLAGYISLLEPMRRHEFSYYGTASIADPVRKSFFYSKYVNNSFKPRLELSYNHFPSASGFFGTSREVRTTDVVALTSLWKLTGLSSGYSDWYAGLTLRHLALDYFSEATLRLNHPDIFFNNSKTKQTDLKAVISWRTLQPSRHTLIHPLAGKGLRFSATASSKILGSKVQYARFSLDGYAVLQATGNHRLYVYANGVIDAGEPAGRDYLGFSDNGNYQLPGPDFTGSINPGLDQFVRGYSTQLLGERFIFGKAEYRIPFQFDTNKKLLGFIPPARTSFTFFADGGVIGDARLTVDRRTTEHRLSAGLEIKRVFSIGGSFEFTYELGIAQPLTQAFSPKPFFNVKTAIPF